MNNKTVYWLAAMLAALIVSPVAQAEEIKYFECKVTRQFEYYGAGSERNGKIEADRCNDESGKPCTVGPYRFDLSEFEKTADGHQYINTRKSRGHVYIDRRTGRTHFTRLEECSGCTLWSEGACELKSESTKF